MLCVYCITPIAPARHQLGYCTCLTCGEREAKKVNHTIVPLHKSNYIVITDRLDLHGINNKGGFHR